MNVWTDTTFCLGLFRAFYNISASFYFSIYILVQFIGNFPTTVEEAKVLANDHLVDIVGRDMNYFIGKNGTVIL